MTGTFGAVVKVNDVGPAEGVVSEEESCGAGLGIGSERLEGALGGKAKVDGKGCCSFDELGSGAVEALGVLEAAQEFHWSTVGASAFGAG